MSNLYSILEKNQKTHSDKTAVIYKNHVITYAQLKDAADRLAAGLKSLDLSPGDRMALMLSNNPHFLISYFALLKIGVILVPLSTYETPNEIHHHLEDCEAKGIIFSDKARPVVQTACQGLDHCSNLVVLGPEARHGETRLTYLMEISEPLADKTKTSLDDTALIVYTAGVTGKPKGAELTHRNMMAAIESCSTFFQLKSDDSVASTVPFFLTLGQTLAFGSFLFSGASVVLIPHFDAGSVLKIIQDHHPAYFVSLLSTVQEILAQAGVPDLSSVRCWLTSGDAMKPEIMEAFESRFHTKIVEGYGLTEASSVVSFNNPAGERKPGSIGSPLHGMDIRIVNSQNFDTMPGEVGEIIVQGPNVMKGYLNRPEATKEVIRNGWLYTGDLAALDESGTVSIVARKKNVIMKSGFSVYPSEIEKCMMGHPKIREAVVVGLPDSMTGEEIHACVILKEGETAAPAEIIDYCRERLAAYKCPKTVYFVFSLPKGPAGRVLRDQVKTMMKDKIK